MSVGVLWEVELTAGSEQNSEPEYHGDRPLHALDSY